MSVLEMPNAAESKRAQIMLEIDAQGASFGALAAQGHAGMLNEARECHLAAHGGLKFASSPPIVRSGENATDFFENNWAYP